MNDSQIIVYNFRVLIAILFTDVTLILPIFFVLKISSAYCVCCNLDLEANMMNPDQTTTEGAF